MQLNFANNLAVEPAQLEMRVLREKGVNNLFHFIFILFKKFSGCYIRLSVIIFRSDLVYGLPCRSEDRARSLRRFMGSHIRRAIEFAPDCMILII